MARYNENSKVLSSIIREANRLESNIFEKDRVTSTTKHFTKEMKLSALYMKVSTRAVGGTFAAHRIISPDNTFFEFFTTTDFRETNETTAVWDTTLQRVRIQ